MQALQAGDGRVYLAGGTENMSTAPYLLLKARSGYRYGNGELVDAAINDGLTDPFHKCAMGATAENIASFWKITREDQDAFAAESHRRAAAATAEGRFRAQILPVEVPPAKKGEAPRAFDTDEAIRPETTVQALAKLKPAFKQGGTVTAGNAPGVSDGAAAVVVTSAERANELNLKPMAIVRAQAQAGRAPEWFSLAPIDAVRKVVEKAGWSLDSVDLFELNEAFSVQALAVIRELGLDQARVNINGGAIALGHPIGASGAAVLVKLIYAMADCGAKRGIASLCLGGGSAVALAIESL
jgi:acetyl-CoA C-acetyltransferase